MNRQREKLIGGYATVKLSSVNESAIKKTPYPKKAKKNERNHSVLMSSFKDQACQNAAMIQKGKERKSKFLLSWVILNVYDEERCF